jgi:hypothetical protein
MTKDDNDVLAAFRHRMKLSPGRPGHSEVDLVSDDAEAEAAEAMADPDYEGDPGVILSADDVIDPAIIQDSKRVEAIMERRRVRELQERYPDADIRWDREYTTVHGDISEAGYHYAQADKRGRPRYFDNRGREIKYEK